MREPPINDEEPLGAGDALIVDDTEEPLGERDYIDDTEEPRAGDAFIGAHVNI